MKKKILYTITLLFILVSCTAPSGTRFIIIHESDYFGIYQKGAYDMCVSHALRDVVPYIIPDRRTRDVISIMCRLESKNLFEENVREFLPENIPILPREVPRTREF